MASLPPRLPAPGDKWNRGEKSRMFEKRRELAEEEHQAGRSGGPLEAFGIQGRKQSVPGGGWGSGHCFFKKNHLFILIRG